MTAAFLLDTSYLITLADDSPHQINGYHWPHSTADPQTFH
jgi:hypothetical protein